MAKKKQADQPSKYARRLWLLSAIPWGMAILMFTIASLSGLPDIETLANPKINLATEVISSDGRLLGAFYRENRSDVRYENLPQNLDHPSPIIIAIMAKSLDQQSESPARHLPGENRR